MSSAAERHVGLEIQLWAASTFGPFGCSIITSNTTSGGRFDPVLRTPGCTRGCESMTLCLHPQDISRIANHAVIMPAIMKKSLSLVVAIVIGVMCAINLNAQNRPASDKA